jgi:hypothetical protein
MDIFSFTISDFFMRLFHLLACNLLVAVHDSEIFNNSKYQHTSFLF